MARALLVPCWCRPRRGRGPGGIPLLPLSVELASCQNLPAAGQSLMSDPRAVEPQVGQKRHDDLLDPVVIHRVSGGTSPRQSPALDASRASLASRQAAHSEVTTRSSLMLRASVRTPRCQSASLLQAGRGEPGGPSRLGLLFFPPVDRWPGASTRASNSGRPKRRRIFRFTGLGSESLDLIPPSVRSTMRRRAGQDRNGLPSPDAGCR